MHEPPFLAAASGVKDGGQGLERVRIRNDYQVMMLNFHQQQQQQKQQE
jgi:hypothetical protein